MDYKKELLETITVHSTTAYDINTKDNDNVLKFEVNEDDYVSQICNKII